MSEKMYPIPFASLMNWAVTEYAATGDLFGVHKGYRASGKCPRRRTSTSRPGAP